MDDIEYGDYFIKAEIVKPWFKPAKVVYKIMQNFEYWNDPSYGNGGGDWHKAVRKIVTVDSLQEAHQLIDQLKVK